MFADYARVQVHAGDGGCGCVSFRREKYVPRGGPDGGDGGRGGHIYFVADPDITTLLDVKARSLYSAKRGQHGGGNQCSGRDGEDIYLRVPLGTCVSNEEGEQIADLTEPNQVWMAAKGGHGGRGNQHFATPTNKAPRRFEYGGEGELKHLILELKVIADVGLIGLPNAGKSTLLAHLTKATPKVGAYPFTTIHPNLGILDFEGGERCALADIPGLIEGAHHGAGLGHRFLRHVERTRLLVHLVAPPDDIDDASFEHFHYAWDLVNKELAAYSDELAAKPQIICLTKLDLLDPEIMPEIVEGFKQIGQEVFVISAHDGSGISELLTAVQKRLNVMHEQEEEERIANTIDPFDDKPPVL